MHEYLYSHICMDVYALLTEVISSDGVTGPAAANNHVSKPLPHVGEAVSQSQHSHDLGSHCLGIFPQKRKLLIPMYAYNRTVTDKLKIDVWIFNFKRRGRVIGSFLITLASIEIGEMQPFHEAYQ